MQKAYQVEDYPVMAQGEKHFVINSGTSGLRLFVRFLPAQNPTPKARKTILYIHGGTFPSALSIAHRFNGFSWRDSLNAAGFDVWAFDFAGYGFSDRYAEMSQAASNNEPLGRAEEACQQITQVVDFITEYAGITKLSIIAHSWGTLPAGLFATRAPHLLNRLVFFGPITYREPQQLPLPSLPAWLLLSIQDQRKRFVEDVPPMAAPVLDPMLFEEWGNLYLASDSEALQRTPPSVKIPAGPVADIRKAWQGNLCYDPKQIHTPVAILRGEWDSLCRDEDAAWLFKALANSPHKRDIKLSRGTHLIHLETGRFSLYQAAQTFLDGEEF